MEFLTRICYYEEEEKKIFPHLILRHNIENNDFCKLFQIEIIHLIKETNEKLFLKN